MSKVAAPPGGGPPGPSLEARYPTADEVWSVGRLGGVGGAVCVLVNRKIAHVLEQDGPLITTATTYGVKLFTDDNGLLRPDHSSVDSDYLAFFYMQLADERERLEKATLATNRRT